MKKKLRDKTKFIDATELSLTEWLNMISVDKRERDYTIIDFQFPTTKHLEEYIVNIDKYTEDEVKDLIYKFIIPSAFLGGDDILRYSVFNNANLDIKKIFEHESFLKRLISMNEKNPPWQSISWILDLLPEYPYKAINVVRAYVTAHCLFLSDNGFYRCEDIISLIKAKFINHPLPTREVIREITSREFELLCAYLYKRKGYQINITKKTRDGGYDIIAEKGSGRAHEVLYIECKQKENKVGVDIARGVLGLLNIKNATKSVIITSNYFTKDAQEVSRESKRLELISIDDFDNDMREYVDARWVYRIDGYIREMENSLKKEHSHTPTHSNKSII
ncbi:TPA: restriction endonuclease [Salmonella enterica subsp. salamae serovar 35:g,m,s,t:-]|nr:restriction endonuclease [Salmonella enterica subsp. salamae serovar 35:g,m,s,t:-]HCA3418900.1 restriction endonuclease [Salmonella enterica subsp. salamae serovar 35:g,m,s,t:-]HCA3428067.1 restriction endonuclease [Salmonella enterica subsp. salamae serovar 35:g,m,s,t:-]HCA3437704.1 restriction endonuclease [Salmonella enterica subsp. salamae serovar 35:g,m,s,t:-]HCA3442210.1 restriction endonuclease [Salmonella enterica subsp. salamae serovar 35:g,m,s,t:-]